MTLHDEIARLTQEKIAGSPLFLVEVKVSPNKVTVYLDHPKGRNRRLRCRFPAFAIGLRRHPGVRAT